MRQLVGLLVVVAISVVIFRVYLVKAVKGPAGETTTASQLVDSTGAQTEVLAIARAEQFYQAAHGAYSSIDDLVADHTLPSKPAANRGYAYSVEPSPTGFVVTGRCSVPAGQACSSYQMDQTLELKKLP
ncbi:MAG: hypothetical protein ACRD50_04290 [Candidatus Acidiferrales bacterium]